MVLNTESSLDKLSVYRRQRFYANDTNLSLIIFNAFMICDVFVFQVF